MGALSSWSACAHAYAHAYASQAESRVDQPTHLVAECQQLAQVPRGMVEYALAIVVRQQSDERQGVKLATR